MDKLIIASRNKGKLAEMRAILAPYGIQAVGQDEAGVHIDVVEDGTTFLENAQKKASAILAASGLATLADDSGLCVDALDGRPGIYSARYAGPGASDDDRICKLWRELDGVPDEQRTAQFVCAMVLAYPDGTFLRIQEQCDGLIISQKRGEDGFGYDPVFYVPALGKTFSELTGDEKNAISHRGKALRRLIESIGTAAKQ